MASTNDEADIDDTPTTGDDQINGLLTEYHWSFSARVNFQFTIPDSESDYEDTRDLLIDDYPDDNHIGVVQMPDFMVEGIRFAIRHYESILTFAITEQADNNVDTQLRYGLADFTHDGDPERPAYAYTPQDDGVFSEQANWMSGDTFWNINDFSERDEVFENIPSEEIVGTYQYHTILHETGHALGLKHGHEEDHGNNALPAGVDSMEFTVMTYRGYIGDNPNRGLVDGNPNALKKGYEVIAGNFAQTLMMLDIQALQHIYGANFSTQSGDTVYQWDTDGAYRINGAEQWTTDNGCIFLTVWDGGGIDTYDFSDFITDANIDLTPGKWSNLGDQLAQLGPTGQMARANVFNARMFNNDSRSVIENATGGSGADAILGNFSRNLLDGGDGADDLFGAVGNDTLIGGAGADELYGATGDDFLTGGDNDDLINGGDGFDTALYTSPAGEVVTITPLGNPANGLWSVAGPAQAAGDVLARIEAFGFGNGGDIITIVNGPFANGLTVNAAGGNDSITGSDGLPDVENLTGGAGSDTINPMRGQFNANGGAPGAAPNTWIESLADNDLLVLNRSTYHQNFSWNVAFPAGVPLGLFNGTDFSTARGFARLDYQGSGFQDFINGHLGNDRMRGFGNNDVLVGNTGDDTLEGGSGADSMHGQGGNDTLLGGVGLDDLRGGAENDRIETGGGGDFQVIGEAGNDTIIGATQAEVLDGGGDNDLIEAAGGGDLLFGGAGNDTVNGGRGNDTINPGLGVEVLNGGGEINRLIIDRSATTLGVTFFLNGVVGSDGTSAINFSTMAYSAGSGNDLIRGAAGIDAIAGNLGNDTLEGGLGADALHGGSGNDSLRGGLGLDDLRGGEGHDRIETGGGGDFQIIGEAGNDTIIGAAEVEVLDGGENNDSIQAGGGNDLLRGGGGNDTLFGGTGNDTINPGLGVERLDGGDNADHLIVDRSSTTLGVTFNLNGPAGNDGTRAIGFETLAYSAGSGNDLIRGAGGIDVVAGNLGNDTLEGGLGADTLHGGSDNDTLRGGLGLDDLRGGIGDDRIETGGGGDFQIIGEVGNDTIVGAADAEVLSGGGDDDSIQAGGGNDFLLGDAGNDTLLGGAGNDTMTGGAGADRFTFTTALNAATNLDRINDFVVADDTIVLENAIFTGLAAGVLTATAFRIGAAAADVNDRIIYDSATGALFFDVNGNAAGGATQFASISSATALTNVDFLVV